MIRASVALLLVVVIAGCATRPPPTAVRVVEVPVRQWVPIPDELLDCGHAPEWPQRELTGADVDRWIIAVMAELERCRERMRAIREINVRK